MKTLGLILGIVSALGMLLGFIPLLGWFNWLNIPFAIVSLIINVIVNSKGGIILSSIAALFGLIRLIAGAGIV